MGGLYVFVLFDKFFNLLIDVMLKFLGDVVEFELLYKFKVEFFKIFVYLVWIRILELLVEWDCLVGELLFLDVGLELLNLF